MIDLCCKDGMEKLESFLTSLNIEHCRVNEDSYGFSRTIRFFINNEAYDIVWYINESTLMFKGLRIKFRYILIDTTYPVVAKYIVQFSYDKQEKWSDVRLVIK